MGARAAAKVTCGLFWLGWVGLAAAGAGPLAADGGPAVRPIPREWLLGAPDRTAPSLSPDGRQIAFLAPDSQGVMNVWVAPLTAIGQARQVTAERNRPIAEYSWAPDSGQILYLQDNAGDENNQLFGVPLSGGPAVAFTAFPHTNTTIVASSSREPGVILIALNRRDPHWPDVYRLHLAQGRLELLWSNPGGYRSVIADRRLKLRLAVKARADGGYQVDRFEPDGSLREVLATGFEDSQTTAIVSVATGDTAYLLDSRGRDTAALKTLNLMTGSLRDEAAEARVDIASNSDGGVGGANTLILNPSTGEVEAYSVNDLELKWVPLGDRLKPDIAYLDGNAGGQWSIASQSSDDRLWIISVDKPAEATAYYLFDRGHGSLSWLFSERPKLERSPLSRMTSAEITARDGKRLVSYLSLPAGESLAAGQRAPREHAAVLVIHGGPDERNVFGYNGYHQWLTNRGYAVLSINYRGSTGFGKAFTNSRAWSPEVSQDLLDGIDWLVAHGVARRDRVAIMGGSYGGYATLAGLTNTPQTYACGVDSFGPTDLPGLLSRDSVPSEWNANYEHLVRVFGDPRTEAGRLYLQQRSPATRVNEIVRPILIAQGANDPRVRKSQSDGFARALDRRRVDVTYAVFPDEGHGFLRAQNSLAFAAVTEAFLQQCLGGALQPIDGSLRGSSIQIPLGVARIPGLEAALAASRQGK